MIESSLQDWSRVWYEIESVASISDEQVLATVRAVAEAPGPGRVEYSYRNRWTIRDGRVVEIEAFGLTEHPP
jgi:hypothetical protein